MSDEQELAVAKLKTAMDEFALALEACSNAGLEPADAFRAAGVPVPGYAAPFINTALLSLSGGA